MNWMAYNGVDGDLEHFNTEKEAIDWCESIIQDYAGDQWPEGMEQIYVAKITHSAHEENKITKEEYLKDNPKEEWFYDEWKYICDYVMKKEG